MVENLDNIWCNLMHLKKGVMGLQVRTFKNCNKWTPAYIKISEDEKVYILNKCSYSNQETI